MTYSPNMNSLTRNNAAFMVDQSDIERTLQSLISKQSGGHSAEAGQMSLPKMFPISSLDEWKRGQLDFARRIAHITAKHAARHKAKYGWKHRSIGLLRRLALVVMVTTILSVQYL
ncbi:hypothetical protein [Planktotalea sp.]|uniref:hypothetical protein n=1 Tax=Planktotalea sp. TaxID=2029877 RepID=UPI0032971C10